MVISLHPHWNWYTEIRQFSNDFITENEKDLNYLPQDYEFDSIRSVRNNQDTSVNECGQQLLDLCIRTKLRILNGRTRGDLQWHLTYVGFHGCSTVDLVLASETSLTKSAIVQYLSVQDLNFLSENRPILITILGNYNFLPNKIIKDTHVCELKHKPTWYTWTNSLGKDFPLQLSLETNKISNVHLGNESDANFRFEMEHTLGKIQNAFIRSAVGVLRRKILKTGKKHTKNIPHKKWFNLICKQIRTNLQRLG